MNSMLLPNVNSRCKKYSGTKADEQRKALTVTNALEKMCYGQAHVHINAMVA